MPVTLAPVEYMQRNKNRNETYVEACFKTFRKQGNIIHKGNYGFFTILHLIIFPKQYIVVPVDRKRPTHCKSSVTASLANERLSAALKSNHIKSHAHIYSYMFCN